MPDWKRLAAFLRWGVVSLVLFGLPFLLLAYGVGAVWEAREREAVEQAFEQLDTVLLAIRKEQDTKEYLGKLLATVFRRYRRNGLEGRGGLPRVLGLLRQRFPGVFRFVVFAPTGEIQAGVSDPVPVSHGLLQRFYATVCDLQAEKREAKTRLNTLFPMFRTFLGSLASPDQIERKLGDVIEVGMTEEFRYFFFGLARGRGGFLAHLSQSPDWPLLALLDRCRRFRAAAWDETIRVGIFDPSLRCHGRLPDAEGRAMGEFVRSPREHVVTADVLLAVMPVTSTGRLWASLSRSRLPTLDRRRWLFVGLGTLLFGTATWWAFLVIVVGRPFPISIRWQLIGLFAFAGGLPLLVMGFAGLDYLAEKFASRVRAAHDEAARSLTAFDMRFPLMRAGMEARLRKVFRPLRFETEGQWRAYLPQFLRLAETFRISDLQLFDKKGKRLWKRGEDVRTGKSRDKADKFTSGLVRTLCSQVNQEPDGGPMDSMGLLLESLGGSSNPLMSLTRSLTKIIAFSLMENEFWLYIFPFRTPALKITHVMWASWKKFELEALYLGRSLAGSQRDLPDTRFVGVDFERNTVSTSGFPHARRMAPFLRKLAIRQGNTIGTLRVGNVRYLLTGIKPKEMTQNYLAAAQSDARIRAEIDLLWKRMQVFGVMSVFISLFIGIMLSRRFLTPIGDLAAGVAAIEERRFAHRLPPGNEDELGDLARTFNHVMEGLSELEVGRIVQESLVPEGTLEALGYRVFGQTHTATQLGGDYIDLKKLPDGRMLVLIGDVSGHGVPAALVMAMAKALVERECEGHPTPEGLLGLLHRVFFQTLKRKRMMTCFLGLLDPETHEFSMANAGHNYPYLFRPGEPPRAISKSSFPLGSRKNLTLSPEMLVMQPGDRVVMYTDGLIEATVGEQPLGYDRMLAGVAPWLGGDDPRTMCERVFAWHGTVVNPGPQEDDISLIILARPESPDSRPARA